MPVEVKEVALRKFGFLTALFVCCVTAELAAQGGASQNVFTISVAAPTSAKDVQVRYYFTGEFGGFGSSIATPTDDNKIVIKTGVEGKAAKSFRLIAYAPGCQFVTISVDDLSATRQGEFQCTHLNTLQFYGRANVSAFAEKALQVQVLYGCDWAGAFFGMTGTVSPFSLGKADIASDGSFTLSLPDFSADPLWSSRANNATLMFLAADGASGQPLAALKVSSDSAAKGGGLKVAPSYPQVEFSIQSN
jgi:hypothetical protein